MLPDLYRSTLRYASLLASILLSIASNAQQGLIANVAARKTVSLNGDWQYIVDPYETGFYNYRWQERSENDREAYWNTDVPENKTERKEHGYTDEYILKVPQDWNSQDPKFLYYEGTVWYKKSFNATLPSNNESVYIHFGAVNYEAHVYLNGQKLGMHTGGFTPFNFEIPRGQLREENNFLVVKVDNRRHKDAVPTLNTDWWNYGGITRDVNLITVPATYIQDYFVSLDRTSIHEKQKTINGWVVLHGAIRSDVTIEIPELKVKTKAVYKTDTAYFSIKIKNLQLWTLQNPKLYQVIVSSANDRVIDKVGFRTIAVKGKQILLNNVPVFLRGICIHEEIPQEMRRANGRKDALQLLGQAKELNANMVRLAHYPHNEAMMKVADSLGILVWSEIPVYWTIDFANAEVLNKAKQQLQEMIQRDRNRASIVIWSVGNETPVNESRTNFMRELVFRARALDNTRLVSAALEVHNVNGTQTIDDPLGQYTDIVSVNEYLGWYGGLPNNCRNAKWAVKYDKPLFFSETGAEALGGFHADSLTRWSEEYQEWYYREQIEMMKRMPDNYVGISPWILNDFRSPKRNNPLYQEGWNNKGLFDQKGNKKKAFYVLKRYYDEVEKGRKSQ
jgi:beta-glucuronidase